MKRVIERLSDPDHRFNLLVAKNSNKCILCGKPATKFSSFLFSFEYSISAICEACQKVYFHNELINNR